MSGSAILFAQQESFNIEQFANLAGRHLQRYNAGMSYVMWQTTFLIFESILGYDLSFYDV